MDAVGRREEVQREKRVLWKIAYPYKPEIEGLSENMSSYPYKDTVKYRYEGGNKGYEGKVGWKSIGDDGI